MQKTVTFVTTTITSTMAGGGHVLLAVMVRLQSQTVNGDTLIAVFDEISQVLEVPPDGFSLLGHRDSGVLRPFAIAVVKIAQKVSGFRFDRAFFRDEVGKGVGVAEEFSSGAVRVLWVLESVSPLNDPR